MCLHLMQRHDCVPAAGASGSHPAQTAALLKCCPAAFLRTLQQDGEVPRDVEFAQVRRYMIRRCRYAAALIMNVQVGEWVNGWMGALGRVPGTGARCKRRAGRSDAAVT